MSPITLIRNSLQFVLLLIGLKEARNPSDENPPKSIENHTGSATIFNRITTKYH